MGGETRSDAGGDATPDVPQRGYAEPFWLEAFDQIVENPVRNIFVKSAFVPEAPQVQLQALQLEDPGPRHIGDREHGEVGLASHRADARELGAHALNLIVPVRMRIGDRYEFLRRHRRHIWPTIIRFGALR